MKTLKVLLALLLCGCLMLPLGVTAEKGELEEDVLMGDVDGDGKVTSTDARLVLIAAIIKMPMQEPYRTWTYRYGNVDGDTDLTSTDARLILQYAIGKIDAFPCQTAFVSE